MRRHTACSETDANKLITGDNVRKRVNAVTRRIRGVKHKMTGNLNFKNLDSTYRDGDFRKAVFMAQDIVAAHPNNSEAKYKLALALSRDSQLLRAEATLSSIVPDFGSPGQTERRYKRALEVVRAKIVDAGKWVENSAGPPLQKTVYDPAVGERSSPTWLLLAQLLEKNSGTGSDHVRRTAELSMTMHSWSQSAERYQILVSTGNSSQKDLRNYAKCLIKSGQNHRLDSVLAELNNMRLRAKQTVLTISDLAASIGEYEFAAKDINISILDGFNDLSELDKAQLRLRRAGQLSEAFHVGRVMSTIQHRDKLALRTGLYAEQLGLKSEAMSQYDSIIASAPGTPTVASLRLARLVASGSDEEAAKQALILACAHWVEFDEEHMLFYELADALGVNTSQTSTERIEIDSSAVVQGWVSKTNTAMVSVEEGSTVPVKTIVDRVRATTSRPSRASSIESGANASRELRKARAFSYLDEGAFGLAISEAQKLVFGADDFVSSDLVFLAYVLARSGQLVPAARALSASEENPDSFRYQASSPGDRHKQVFRYLSLRDELPLSDNVFLWETHFGNRIDCNPYAMWNEICSRDVAGEYVHIWVCNDPANAPADVLANKQTVVTKRESSGYWHALAVAKYLVNNASFSHEFLKREGQVCLNTWHGTPLKALGRDDHDSPYDYGNVSRNIVHSSDLVMPSRFTADTFLNQYSVGSLCPAQVHVLGQARNDRLVNMTLAERLNIRASLGIGPEARFVLYAPTWRGGSKNSWFDVDRLQKDLVSLGSADGYIVGFRGHPLAMKYLDNLDADVLVPDSNISTYDLLAIADVLITDYSSLGIDFLCRELPVVYYVHDYEEYAATRGLYFDRNEFPGHVVDDIDQLLGALRLAKENLLVSDSRLKAFRESFAPFDDGNASSRAADVLLSSTGGQSFAPGSAGDSLPILLTHDLSNRDSLELFVRTANSLAGAGSSVVVGFNHSRVVSDPGLVQVLDSLSPDIHVLPRKGMFAQTASEFAASEQFIRNDRFGFVEGRNSYISALEREAERLYGNIRFSFAVSWGVDDVVLAGLCAYGVSADRRIAYIDSDIGDLWPRCFPSRARVLHLFPGFDEILVPSAKNQHWLYQNVDIENVRIVGRSIGSLPVPGRSFSGTSSGSIVVVGADTDLTSLRAGLDAAVKCVQTHNAMFGGVVVYVQGPARDAVAEMLREDCSLKQMVEIRTDDFPYGGTPNLELLVDCGGGEIPSVAMLDASAAGVPVLVVAEITSSLDAGYTYDDQVDALVSATESTLCNGSVPEAETGDMVPDLATLLSGYIPQ